MRRLAALLGLGVFVLAACGSGGEETTKADATTTTTAVKVTTTTTIPTEPASWSDEPCTRAVSKPGALPALAGFRLDDLERMVLNRDDVGGLRGFESDMGRHGYWGNGELRSMEVNPPSTCDDMKKFGRITGFANAYTKWTEPERLVTFSAHLFHSEADARGWVDAFREALTASVGTDDGPTRFDVKPFDELGAGAYSADHVGPNGTRKWIMFVRGPIVGWVTDLNRNIDVAAAATAMATRVEQITKSIVGPDATRLLSAPLPLSEYGDRYAGLQWNFFFGGCADTEERASIAGEEAANRAAGFGRINGCTNMYDPPEGMTSTIVRVFSSVSVFKDAAGVSADIADRAERLPGEGGQRFDVAVGDDALGSVIPSTSVPTFTATSVVFRVGNLEAVVAIQDQDARDAKAEVTALATKLHARLERLLSA